MFNKRSKVIIFCIAFLCFCAQAQSQNVEKDIFKPLYIKGNGGHGDKLLWYSTLSEYTPELSTSINFSADDDRGYSITFSNASIRELCRLLYGKRWDTREIGGKAVSVNFLPLSRIELRVSNPDKYIASKSKYKTDASGKKQFLNAYVYQLFSKKPVTVKKLREMARADFERYFDISIFWEKQDRQCLVFTAKDTSLISYKKGKKIFIADHVDGKYLELNNVSMSELVDYFPASTSYYSSPYPIIDETGLQGKLGHIELVFKGDRKFTNHEALHEALQKYGMGFTLQKRKIDILVITKNLKN